jgi:hypothetical protein
MLEVSMSSVLQIPCFSVLLCQDTAVNIPNYYAMLACWERECNVPGIQNFTACRDK